MAFPDRALRLDRVIAPGDTVVAEWTSRPILWDSQPRGRAAGSGVARTMSCA